MSPVGPNTYIPLILERFEIYKLPSHCFIRQYGLVLLQQSVTDLGIIRLGDRIFQIRLLELV